MGIRSARAVTYFLANYWALSVLPRSLVVFVVVTIIGRFVQIERGVENAFFVFLSNYECWLTNSNNPVI